MWNASSASGGKMEWELLDTNLQINIGIDIGTPSPVRQSVERSVHKKVSVFLFGLVTAIC